MKVILNKDVPKIGRKYETRDVAPGFARNYLIPRNLAEVASKAASARIAMLKSLHDEQIQLAESELIKQFKTIAKAELVIEGKANEKGHLFAGIHAEEIQKALRNQADIIIATEYISLPKALKEVGEHTITIAVQDKETTLKLTIKEAE